MRARVCVYRVCYLFVYVVLNQSTSKTERVSKRLLSLFRYTVDKAAVSYLVDRCKNPIPFLNREIVFSEIV